MAADTSKSRRYEIVFVRLYVERKAVTFHPAAAKKAPLCSEAAVG